MAIITCRLLDGNPQCVRIVLYCLDSHRLYTIPCGYTFFSSCLVVVDLLYSTTRIISINYRRHRPRCIFLAKDIFFLSIFLLPRVCSLCTWRRGAVYCFSPARNYWNLFWEPRNRSTTRLRTVRVIFVLSFFLFLFIRNLLRPIFAIKRRGRRQLKTIKTTEIQDV